jgi:hypothetical protein
LIIFLFFQNSTSNGAESSLSMQEIQKLEEEREREAKMRRDIQEAANARARQEEEARRQQVRECDFFFIYQLFQSNRYM